MSNNFFSKKSKESNGKANQMQWDNSLSDFEAGKAQTSFKNSHNYYQFSKSLPAMSAITTDGKYSGLPQTDDLYTDDEQAPAVHPFSADEFADDVNARARSLKTGRQRKKLAARSKGSEFRANRKKKRVYFCCISSEIEVPRMLDELLGGGEIFGKWKYRVYTDVLHLYKEEPDLNTPSSNIAIGNIFLRA